MSCKKIQKMLNKSDLPEMSDNQRSEIENHINSCEACHELYNRDMILSSLFAHAETDETYFVPEDVMKAKVNKRLLEPQKPFNLFTFFRKPFVIPAATLVLFITVSISYFSIQDSHDIKHDIENDSLNRLFAYEVNLNGISPEFAEDHAIICDMLSSAGLDDASVDILGCEQSCEVVIFDLKNKEEAELVVDIFQAIDKDVISTKVNQVNEYNQQVL